MLRISSIFSPRPSFSCFLPVAHPSISGSNHTGLLGGEGRNITNRMYSMYYWGCVLTTRDDVVIVS